MDTRIKVSVVLALLGLAACGDQGGAKPGASAQTAVAPAAAPVQAAAAPAESAQDVFKNRCSPCHGLTGHGDGPAAAALNPKPRNYTDATWQKSVTDEQIKNTILYGGAAVGKSAVMPSQPDLESHPETLAGLIAIIRDFGKAP